MGTTCVGDSLCRGLSAWCGFRYISAASYSLLETSLPNKALCMSLVVLVVDSEMPWYYCC